jgi:uncharacterized protein YdhG (YjbR/CyaY superfamily)
MKQTGAKTIDEYLSALPEDVRPLLTSLRKTIKSTSPQAEEVISYQMPAFKYHGILVYFAAFKNHCSFFPGSASSLELIEEVKPFKTSKGTLQFTVDKPLPVSLVKKIVKIRMKENEDKALAKELKKSTVKKTTKNRIKKK